MPAVCWEMVSLCSTSRCGVYDGSGRMKQKTPAKFMVKEIEELHPRIRNSNMDDADPNSHFKFLLQRGT